jgi:hypothetical protein
MICIVKHKSFNFFCFAGLVDFICINIGEPQLNLFFIISNKYLRFKRKKSSHK